MGNDGGSIPDRRDLVKNKPKAEQADKANQTKAKWFFCALSKKPLQEPVVSCPLGKLYNKDAIIEYLLDKSAYGDGEDICGHIRSLKDVKTLKLTPNTAKSTNQDEDRAAFICPLTLKEMNGKTPFVYLSTCGCVIAQTGLKTMLATKTDEKELCPQCATKFSSTLDIIQINPDPIEAERLWERMLELRKAEPVKKSKKRKHDGDEGREKSTKKEKPGPVINSALKAVTSSLAMEEAKRKATMSDAVKSLYGDGQPAKKETFMTFGTFTRYA